MNEIKFNSQICTTKEQSQHLLDLGLKPETADMIHHYTSVWGWFIFPCNWNVCTISEEHIPAWSLHRLICMCEVTTLLPVDNSSSAYDHIIDVIERFINEGYFNKEYLKQ